MNNPRHIFLWLMFLLCFVATSFAGNRDNYSSKDSTLTALSKSEVPGNNHLKPGPGCNVKLPPDYGECNNGVIHFQSDPLYTPVYSDNLPGDSYNWIITGETGSTVTYMGGSTSSDRYPTVQLESGYNYKIILQYTTGGITCSDTQIIYKRAASIGSVGGSTPVCAGVVTAYTNIGGDVGGTWSSASPSIATVDPVTGMVTAISAGSSDITYTVNGCSTNLSATKTITVSPNANPGVITGPETLCIGTSGLYTSSGDEGGNWSTFMPSGITVDPETGRVTAITPGISYVIYTAKGCQFAVSANYPVTVKPNAKAGTISGPTPLCIGSTPTYTTNGDVAGDWSSASPLIASIDLATGKITAISAGTAIITYTIVNGCGPNISATYLVTVSPDANPGKISGETPLCIGASSSYTTSGDAGGVWTSSSPSIAIVDPVTGVITAVSAGVSDITYTISGCGTNLNVSKQVTVSPVLNSGTIAGANNVCIGSASANTTNGDAGGVWSSATTSVATIDPASGVFTAIAAGETAITYTASGCAIPATKLITVNPNATPGVVSGETTLCIGSTGSYSSVGGDAGGSWTSASPLIATINPVTGIITAISAGTSVITYTVSGCGTNLTATQLITVSLNANPGTLSGENPLCIGASGKYTSSGNTGGAWSSASPTVATVDPVTGIITAISTGTSAITYTLSGCGTNLNVTKPVTVSLDANPGTISGGSPLCINATTTYTTNGDSGGSWSSASPSVATVDPVTGAITAISTGTSDITYTVSGCGVNLTATKAVTVSLNANAGTLSGISPLCSGTSGTYTTNGNAGGTWTSSSTSVATVNPVTGVLTAISAGTATLTYTVSGCGPNINATIQVTVSPKANSGSLSGVTPVCIGTSTPYTTNGDAGGTWTSASPSIATVDPFTGIIKAISAGVSDITYTVTGCTAQSTTVIMVSPDANAGAINGATPLCIGTPSRYTSNGDAGGTWISSSPSIATVDPESGLVTAISAGITTISYTVSGCGTNGTATQQLTVNATGNAGTVSGATPVCEGASPTYTTSGDAGGVWSSSSTSVATVDPSTGSITAISAGTSTIAYKINGCAAPATKVITVSLNANAGAVSGVTPVCIGATATYTTNGDAGGTWSSTSPSIATVDPASGIVTGISAGTSIITYKVSGCGPNLIATQQITVSPSANAGAVIGLTPVCIGATPTYTSTGDAGGTWSSTSPSIATVNPLTGKITAIKAGTSTITYTVSGCAAPSSIVLTVSPNAKAGTVSGANPLCIGKSTKYTSNGDAGGVWTSASPLIATVDPVTGIITAVSAGKSVITYTVTGCGVNTSATKQVTVSPDANAGILSGTSPLCIGTSSTLTTNGDAGGTWSSTSPSIATVVGGVVTAVSAGTTTITYTLSGCGSNLTATIPVTVSPNANPGIISGATPVCIGATPTYTTNGDAGGVWSSGSPSVVTIDPSTGVITAISAGTSVITYTISGCAVQSSKTITVNPNVNAGILSGLNPLCKGTSSTYITNGDAGGTWTSATPSVAIVDPVTGVVTAISEGTSVITYTINGCGPNVSATIEVTVIPIVVAGTVSGATPLCIGTSSLYTTNGDAGGSWSSTSTAVATVDPSTGMVTTISAGTTTIIYSISKNGCGASNSKILIVSPDAKAGTVNGVSPVCIGVTATYISDGDAGGVWTSGSPLVATVDPVTGIVTAISAGTSDITYTVTGCGPNLSATRQITVSPITNAGAISGTSPLCIGATATYSSDGDAGGVWTSNTPFVATVNSVSGMVTAINAGFTTITYTVSGCASPATKVLTVSPQANAGTVSGETPLCIGASGQYTSNGDAGGAWNSTSASVATVDPVTGVVTGTVAGNTTITYTVSGCGTNLSAFTLVTVRLNATAGTLTGASPLCIGTSMLYTITNGDAGGIWTSASPSIATVDPSTGMVKAISEGTAIITYTVSGCGPNLSSTIEVTVSRKVNAGVLNGVTPVCIGSTPTYTTNGDAGGTWSSGSLSVATIDPATGKITAISEGTSIITYTISGCGAISTTVISVSPDAKAGTVSGATPLCIGTSGTYTSDGNAGGAWSSSLPSVATVDVETGLVTAIGAGTSTITYTISGCGPNLQATQIVTVNPDAHAGILSGATPVCIGATPTYTTSGDAGGTWNSSELTVATVDASTGLITAIGAGTTTITYTVTGCAVPRTKTLVVNPNANAGTVSGATPLCIGIISTYITNGDAGGVWGSASPLVATIDPVTGAVKAISAGTATITYTVIGCGPNLSTTQMVTVSPAASAGVVTGMTPVCIGATTPYTTNGDAGGVWSSASPSVATVVAETGIITAVSAGEATIIYTVSGCASPASKVITVSPNANAGTLSGATPLCIGTSGYFSTSGDAGGAWSSSSPLVATIDPSTGLVTAISAGPTTISYTVIGCGTNLIATQIVTVSPDASAGIVSGITPVCIGATPTYTTNGNTGGAWSSNSPLVATIDPLTGVITTISAGTTTITYSVIGCSTNLIATQILTVNPDAISGAISGTTTLCTGITSPFITNGDAGGTWSSSSPLVATIDPSTGMVTTISAGTTTITYTLIGCGTNLTATQIITVSPNVSAGVISGLTPLCIGVTTTYTTSGNAGGAWTSASPLVATVDPETGLVTAVSAGTAVISYAAASGCGPDSKATQEVMVNPDANPGILNGPTPVCIGTSNAFTTDGDAGGTWRSTMPSVATVDPATGVITAIRSGTTTITYTVIGCGTNLSTVKALIVSPDANAGTISGITPLCIGTSRPYTSDGDGEGVWTSTSPTVATIDPIKGVVTAISAGNTTITYTVNGCSAPATKVVTVSPDANPGFVSGATTLCIGTSSLYTSDGDAGGSWSTFMSSGITVDPVTGMVSAKSAGTFMIIYTARGGQCDLSAFYLVTVNPQANAGILSGVTPLCIGATSAYTTDGDAGGAWSSTSPSIATVDPVSGVVTAISAGKSSIIYTAIGCSTPSATKELIVSPNANAGIVSGMSPLCIGAITTYTGDGDAGGSWSSSSASIATVDPVTGLVTAISAGTATITYTVTGCGTNLSATKEVTVSTNANAGIVSGTSPLCIGTTATYTSNGDAGGAWSSSSPSIATVDAATGLITAISAGLTTITYLLTGCTTPSAMKELVVSPNANSGIVSGETPLCIGVTSTYTSNGDAGGGWSSSSQSIATVDPVTGVVTAISAGITTITYTVNGCGTNLNVTKDLTVSPNANDGIVSGTSPICIGITTTYTSNGDAGGVWSSSSPSIATVDPVTGLVTALSSGTTTITYTVNGCGNNLSAFKDITVSLQAYAGILSGNSPLCIGATTTYTSNGDAGGSWSSSSPSIATIDPVTGVVTAISAGTAMIAYTITGCTNPIVTKELIVSPQANAGIVSGTSPLCIGITTTYTSNGDSGGRWSSSSPSMATVDPFTGLVTALSSGTTTITYTVNGCGNNLSASKDITVSLQAYAGRINGTSPLCIGVATTYTSNGEAGGGWSSSSPSVATIDPVTGVITAISAGITTITYTVTGCGGNLIATKDLTVSPNANAGIVSGTSPLCIGITTTYISDGDAGGVWSSSSTSIATVDPVTGVVTAISAGTTTITYTVTGCGTNLSATKDVIVSPNANAGIVSGTGPLCIGVNTTFTSNGDDGGTWSSSSQAVATIDPVTGVITAISAGTSIITYTASGCSSPAATKVVQVTPNANAGIVSGTSPLCIGATTTYTSDGDAGGVWSSTSPSVATVDPVTGMVTAINAGTAGIIYSVGGCSSPNATKNVTVSPNANAGIIDGLNPLCIGATSTFKTNGDAGGVWSSNTPSVATIDPLTGIITAISAGTATITYSISNNNNCNSFSTKAIIVNGLPVASFNASLAQTCENSLLLLDSNLIKLNKDANTSQYQWFINDSLIGISNYFPGYAISQKDDLITIKLKTISLFGCNSDSISKVVNVIHPPKTSFTLSDTLGCGPLTINFNNTTTGTAYQYHWNFGNGSSSDLAQPAGVEYNYSENGLDTTYTVSLTAFSQCDTITVYRKIVVKRKAKVDFSATPTIGCSPIKVAFRNNSIGDNTAYKLWFGDGSDTLLTMPSISHNYYTGVNTIYYAKLVAVNTCGADSVIIPITGSPNTIKPAVYAKDSVLCGSPNKVTLLNNTTGANQFNWDFGDGTTITSSKSPDSLIHVYTQNGTYTVRVLISNGCSDTTILRNIYLYSVPKADFTAVPMNVCLGDSVHFHSLTDLGSSILWHFGDGYSSIQDNPVYSYKNAGIYNVMLRAANANNTCYDSIVKPIEVVASRQGYLQVSDTIGRCLPFKVSFINRSTPSVSTLWNFGDGNSAKGDSVTHSFIAAGNYKVTMLAISPGGCRFTDSTNISVTMPVGKTIYNNGLSCNKGPVKFEAITTGADSVRWDFGDGTTLTSGAGNGPVYHTFPRAGIYLPKAWFTTTSGCSVLINRLDTIKIEEVVAAFKLAVIYDCGKTTYNFIDSSHSFFGINDWDWNIGPASFSSQRNVTQVYNQAGVYPVTLIVTGNTGCRDTIKSNLQVAIYQYPKVNISGIAAVCKESLINLRSQVESNDSIKSLLWDLGNGLTSKDSTVQILYNSSGSYLVKLTVSTINKCYDSAYKQLTIYSAPAISLNRTNTICRGASIDILASGASNYIWKDKNDSIICNGCSSINVTPLNNVQYKVIGYNQYGCSKVDSASINVIQPFKIAASPGDSICIGSEKRLFATGASSYSWYPENSLNNCTSATVYASPLVTTTYRVIGKDKNQCFADTSHVTVVVGNPTPLDIGRDTVMLAGGTYTFNPVLPSEDIKKWSWSGLSNISCVNCPNPQARIVYDVCVSCTIINRFNCPTTDTLCIKTFCPDAEVFVPNAFTPDGDGINDRLMVQGKGITLIKSFRIFSRWGEMIFERTNFLPGDPAYAWDGKVRGKLASPDVFVYVCEAICAKGYASIFKGNTAILK